MHNLYERVRGCVFEIERESERVCVCVCVCACVCVRERESERERVTGKAHPNYVPHLWECFSTLKTWIWFFVIPDHNF
jgi:hypothetical protein